MIRAYGNAPYRVALLHGGPGAPGTLAPLARRLSCFGGMLEHLQTQYDLPSLLHNISEELSPFGPVIVAGHSWGAWLGLWTAALFPAQVHRLILIGSAPLTDAYVPQIMQRRLANLSSSKANCMANALAMLENGNSQQRQTAMEALPALPHSRMHIKQRRKPLFRVIYGQRMRPPMPTYGLWLFRYALKVLCCNRHSLYTAPLTLYTAPAIHIQLKACVHRCGRSAFPSHFIFFPVVAIHHLLSGMHRTIFIS